jgi:uncharacterized protein (DUF362 family)
MPERVSVVSCPSTLSDEAIVARTVEAIRRLPGYDQPLRRARKIAVKINAGISRFVLTDGRQTELTDPAVVEGVIRVIRDVTDAEIVVGDAPTAPRTDSDPVHPIYQRLGYPDRLNVYPRVRLLDFGDGDMVEAEMSHDDPIFSRYWLHRELLEADAFVSVAKMKAHASMGVTLCIKNLFGWTPPAIYGYPRMYLHDRLIRLPRVLADLALHFRPVLNVVDGMVALNKSEWHGEALRPGVIVAGTNVVATDSVAARVMCVNPGADYPAEPFYYRRNAIKLAAEAGLGPIVPNEIEILGPRPEELAVPFKVDRYDGDTNRDEQLRRGAATVDRYLNERDPLLVDHEGRYIALREEEVLWHAASMQEMIRLERESGRDWRTAPDFVVRCLPEGEETEDFRWYECDATTIGARA